MKKLSYEELLENLRYVVNKLGKIPTKEEYIRYGKYSSDPYTDRMLWSEWCNKVGFYKKNKFFKNIKGKFN